MLKIINLSSDKKFILLLLFFLSAFLFLAGACTNDIISEENNTDKNSKESEKTTAIEEGKYLVHEEIEPGLYRVILTDLEQGKGFFVRAADSEFIDVLAGGTITGDGYIEILDTDVAINFFGIELYPIEYSLLDIDLKKEVFEGTYLIGIDLSPGTYDVEVTNEELGLAYIERASSVTMSLDDIIENKLFSDTGEITIKDDDFALKIEGGKIIKQQ